MIFTGLEPVLSAWRAIVITNYTKRPFMPCLGCPEDTKLLNFYWLFFLRVAEPGKCCRFRKGVFSNLIFTSFNRAKAGFEPTASAHETEILPLNYFALN
jgi:hypothetical protein